MTSEKRSERRTARGTTHAIDASESPERITHASAARGVCVRSLVGVPMGSAADGPAYTLSPEPMTSDPIVDAQGRPRSVWSALLGLSGESYASAVRAVWPDASDGDAAYVLADSLLFEATQTRAFEALPSGGWRVFLDRARRAWVEVAP